MLTDYNVGDKVRVCHESDFTQMLVRQGLVKSYIGRTGTVIETRYNRNMAGYGMGNEVIVRLDDDFDKNNMRLFCDIDLEKIK